MPGRPKIFVASSLRRSGWAYSQYGNILARIFSASRGFDLRLPPDVYSMQRLDSAQDLLRSTKDADAAIVFAEKNSSGPLIETGIFMAHEVPMCIFADIVVSRSPLLRGIPNVFNSDDLSSFEYSRGRVLMNEYYVETTCERFAEHLQSLR